MVPFLRFLPRLALGLAYELPCAARVQTASVTTLHSFVGPTNGMSPRASLVLGRDGNFYGATQGVGPAEQGTVFVITPAGRLTTLYSFGAMIGPANTNGVNADGAMPTAGLVQAADGNFYGTTLAGGAYGYGTVFSVTPRRHADGRSQLQRQREGHQSTLLPTANGGFYGVAQLSGAYSNGTVFALSPAGTLTTLHDFTNEEGRSPQGALVSDAAGNLYGTLSDGGPYTGGAVFTIIPTRALTILHSFMARDGPDGSKPVAGLVRGRAGNFYGTTSEGGQSARDTAFVVTPAGALTVLHNFGGSAAEGTYPDTVLVPGSDGNFYDTTNSGGSDGNGTTFVMTPGGVTTTIYHFAGPDGARPNSNLVRASDGSFYGASYAGGLYNLGVVYRLSPGGTTPATTPAPDAQMGGAHPDTVTQSDNGDAFTLIVANVGTANTGGTVTVTVTPGAGLSLANVSGPGWACARNGAAWTCTRADALSVGHNYPALTALVNVSPDAPAAGTLTSHVTTADDGHAANDAFTDRFPINAAASTPTQRWRYRYFGATANSGSAADTANPAGDGIPNLTKYALGLDPTTAGTSPVTVDTTTSYLCLTAPKNPDATDLSYAVQVDAGPLFDGQGWATDGTVPLQNTATLLQARDATRVGGAGRRFILVEVSR